MLTGHIHQHGQHVSMDVDRASSVQQQQQQQHQDGGEADVQLHRGSKRGRNSSTSSDQPQHQYQAAACADTQNSTPQHLSTGSQGSPSASSSRSSTDLCGQVQTLLQEAATAVAEAGQLPQQGMPAVKVIIPPQQKLSKLPAGTILTSSSPHALAAAARKAPGQQQHAGANGLQGQLASADSLAHALARKFNELAGAHFTVGVVATAAHGHINFAVAAQQLLAKEGQQQQQAHVQDLQQQQQQYQPVTASHQFQQQQRHGHRHQTHHQHQQHQKQQHQQQYAQQIESSGNHTNPGQQGEQQEQRHPQEQQAGQPPEQQQQHRHLEIRMVPNQFIQEEYELYCKYQVCDDGTSWSPLLLEHVLCRLPSIHSCETLLVQSLYTAL